MADALLSIVLDRLASLIQQQIHQEVSLVVGVEREIQSLTNTFQVVRAVVADAEKRQVKEELVKVWLERLKDIAYQMDDVLDEWSTSLLKSQIESSESTSMPKKEVSSCILSPFICFKQVAGRRDIALKIKGIKQEVDEIANQRNQFDFKSANNEEPQRIITISAVDTTEVYGRDMDRDIILRQLLGKSCEQNLGLDTISVAGMGGVGKTTLAQLAFNHHEVKAHFDKKIWVCVSDPFVPIRILRAILEALQGQSSDLHDPEALQQKIQESIDGKKFLLVLDDVWTEDYQLWEQLRNCLKCGGDGSRILVTTRNESVARMMRSTYMHSLGSLPLEQCRALFCQIAFFGKSTDKIEELEEIGKKIADKCNGLPLAIKALGSLLQSKDDKEDWENVLNSEMWELDVFEKKLSPPLLLSYFDLPPALKQCFSYCAAFPKDHSIEIDGLIKLWMAQSYLNSKSGREMETIGREYFENLAARSFFQDFEKDKKGNIVRCKMHDIVHDFAQFLTRNECLILAYDRESLTTNLSFQKVRHATLTQRASGRFSPQNLHTLLIIEPQMKPFVLHLFLHLTYLRALDLRYNNSIVEVPMEVGKFIHLRYLNLSFCSKLVTLPETISELYNLQTLNVRYCEMLRELPQGIRSLINLRHLEIGGDAGAGTYRDPLRLPKGVGRLTSLRTLPLFISSDVCKIEEMRNLNELRGELEIRGLGSVEDAGEAEKAELKNKKHLHHLTLNFFQSRYVEGMRMKRVVEALQPPPNLELLRIAWYDSSTEWPTWIMFSSFSSLTRLKYLELLHCHECQCLPPLGELPLLETLKVFRMESVKYVGAEFLGSSSAIAFPKLKHLSFEAMMEWEKWDVEEEKGRKVMPCLLSLELLSCPKLAAVPDFLLRRTPPLKRSGQADWRRGFAKKQQ